MHHSVYGEKLLLIISLFGGNQERAAKMGVNFNKLEFLKKCCHVLNTDIIGRRQKSISQTPKALRTRR